jgi:ankyrin repeat protein
MCLIPYILIFLIFSPTRVSAKIFDDNTRNLFSSAGSGSYRGVLTATQNGADIEAVDNFGMTVLMTAAQKGHLNIIIALVKHVVHAYPNRYTQILDYQENHRGWSALHYAVDSGKASLVEWMVRAWPWGENPRTAHPWKFSLNALSSDGKTPLMIAVARGHVNVVRVLLESSQMRDLGSFLRQYDYRRKIINHLIMADAFDVFTQSGLLTEALDDLAAQEVMLQSCADGDLPTVQRFIEARTAPVLKFSSLDVREERHTPYFGMTPIMIAATEGHVHIVEYITTVANSYGVPSLLEQVYVRPVAWCLRATPCGSKSLTSRP